MQLNVQELVTAQLTIAVVDVAFLILPETILIGLLRVGRLAAGLGRLRGLGGIS